MGRVLIRPADPTATQADKWAETTDRITGHAIAVRRADCGLGCKCAAEVKLIH
jgi:molybdate-binding protein